MGFTSKTLKVAKYHSLEKAVLDAAKKYNVKIGIFKAEGSDKKTASEDGVEFTPMNALTLVEVATFHEFGTTTIPERSFLRATFDEKHAEITKMARKIINEVIMGGMKLDNGMGIMGEYIQSLVQKRISDGIGPALAASTIRAKGSSKPLINTGQLRQSIRYEVKKGKE